MSADATIRVNTKVNNADLNKLTKSFQMLDEEVKIVTKEIKEMKKAGQQDTEEYKEKVSWLKRVKTGLKDTKKQINQINSSMKSNSAPLADMKERVMSLIKGFVALKVISMAVKKALALMKEGFKNLAQYSDTYNKAMSGFVSEVAELKNNLASAFEPIVSTIIPYITKLISYLNVAIDKVGQFVSALSGKGTYTRAKKQVIDYAKALRQAGSSAQGALASFDQLNVVNKNSGIGAGGELINANAFETANIESEMTSFAERVKSVFEKLKSFIEPIVDDIGKGLVWLYENALKPIGSFVIEDALPNFFNILSKAVDVCVQVFEMMKPALNELWNTVLKPLGEFLKETFIQIFNDVSDAFSDLSDMFGEKSDKIKNILDYLVKGFQLQGQIIKGVLQMLVGAIKPFLTMVVNVVGDIIDVLNGCVDFIMGVFTGDWERAWNGIKDIFKGIINLIIDIYEGAVNMIIGALNNLSIDVPDWVPFAGGAHIGFNLQKMNLPRLAEGAVIPGGKPFAAILGDQRAGQTNIETPLATMVDAFKQAMSERGGAGGEYTFVANIDGREIFRETVSQDQMYRNRTGRSAFAY